MLCLLITKHQRLCDTKYLFFKILWKRKRLGIARSLPSMTLAAQRQREGCPAVTIELPHNQGGNIKMGRLNQRLFVQWVENHHATLSLPARFVGFESETAQPKGLYLPPLGVPSLGLGRLVCRHRFAGTRFWKRADYLAELWRATFALILRQGVVACREVLRDPDNEVVDPARENVGESKSGIGDIDTRHSRYGKLVRT